MSFQYTFIHTCGHTGIGPVITSTPTPPTITPLTLPFACPFCLNPTSTIAPGSGLLCIQTPTYPSTWHIIRACNMADVTPDEWGLCMPAGGRFRQLAWIPRPVGDVTFEGGSVEEDGIRTTARSTRRERVVGGKVVSTLPGLMSRLGAAVRERERAGGEVDEPGHYGI